MKLTDILQLGYECGLNTLDEVYSNVLSHYDLLFTEETFDEEYTELLEELAKEGFLVESDGVSNNAKELIDISIKDAAKKIGYTLKEIDIPSDEYYDDMEDFALNEDI